MRPAITRSLLAAFTVMTACHQVRAETTTSLTADGALRDTGSGLTISQTFSGEYDGVLTGSGGLTVQGGAPAPTITLGGASTYTGPTSLDSVNLIMKSGSSLSSSDFIMNNATLTFGDDTVSVHGGDSDPTLTMSTLSGNGTIDLKAGNLVIGSDGTTGTHNTGITISGIGATGGSYDSGSEIKLYGGSDGTTDYHFDGVSGSLLQISQAKASIASVNAASLTLLNNATLTLTGNAVVHELDYGTGANTSTLNIDGVMHVSSASDYGGNQDKTTINVNSGGQLIIDGSSGYGAGVVYEGALNDNGTIVVNGTNTMLTSGISGSGSLIYNNAGFSSLSLTGSNGAFKGTISATNASSLSMTVDSSFDATIGNVSGMIDINGGGSSDPIHVAMNSNGNGGIALFNGSFVLSGVNNLTGAGVVTSPMTSQTEPDVSYVANGSVTTDAKMLGSGMWGLMNASMTINDASDETLSNQIIDDAANGGIGSLTITGSGVTTITGDNTYAGGTTIASGTTVVNGDESGATGQTTVENGARLGGSGTIGGDVILNNGSTLFAGGVGGGSTGTLTINGNLDTGSATQVFRERSTSGSAGNDLISVLGNLVLGGTIDVSNTDGVSFGDGLYRLYTYGGTLTGSAALAASNLGSATATLETSVDHQVSMLVSGSGGSTGTPIIFWNGSGSLGAISGGNGVWGNAENWTNADATTTGEHQADQIAVFTGNSGIVRVSSDASAVSGLQFANTDKGSYLLTGGAIKASGSNLTIRVGDGTADGASISARIDSLIADNSSAVSVTKTDLGLLTLSGNNTYTGGTTIASGTIRLQSSHALGSGAISMEDGTELDLASNISLSNAISLSGDPEFTVDSGSSVISGPITDGSSSGDLVKDGEGTLILSGTNTYTGNTTINAGGLDVSGAITSSAITVKGGFLDGSGAVSDTTVQSGASVNTTGGLSFSQNLTIDGGTLISGQGRVAQVAGNAVINGGTLDYQTSTPKIGQTSTVLQAGGVSGSFSHVSLINDSGAAYVYISPVMRYLSNQIDIGYARNGTSFGGGTRNQNAVGLSLDSMDSGAILDSVDGMTVAQVREAEDALSGEILSSERTALIQNTDVIRSAVFDRLASADCSYASAQAVYDIKTGRRVDKGCDARESALWGQAFGSLGSNGAQSGMHTLSHSNAGFIMGVDRKLAGWRAGAFASYGRSNMNVSTLASSAHSNDVTVGVYGGRSWGNLSIRLGASYTWNMISSRRTIASPGMSFGRANADHLGGTAQAFSELAYRFKINNAIIEPYANVAYVNQQMTGYHETGSIAALHVRGSDSGTTFATFGSRFSRSYDLANGASLTPYASVGYRHAFGHTLPSAFMQLNGGINMDIGGTPLAQNAVTTELGANYKMTDRVSITIGYRGQYGQHYNDNGITGNFSLKF